MRAILLLAVLCLDPMNILICCRVYSWGDTIRQSEEELKGARVWTQLAVYPGCGYVVLLPNVYNSSSNGTNLSRREAAVQLDALEV